MSLLLVRRSAAALAVAATSATLLVLPAPAQAAATTYTAFGGSAYGSTVKLSGLVNSGKTSYVPMCTTAGSYAKGNHTARLDLGAAGYVGAARTKVSSRTSGSTRTSVTTTSTARTSLLAGLVQASAITSTATVKKSSSGYTRTGSSVFTGLKIGGRSVTARPAPNTTITIPRVATVVLNAQGGGTKDGYYARTVTALRVTLLPGNGLGLPTGTVVIGAANASLHAPEHHRAEGSAYGTEVKAAGVLSSGRTAAVYLPCGGSSGVTRSNTAAGLQAPGLVRVGALRSTARSTDTASRTVAQTQATTGAVDLLNGVVELDAVTARATTTRVGTKVTTSSAGTTVTGLTINGVRRTVSTKPNTTIDIAGIGTLTLHKVVRTATSVQVHAVQLKLTTGYAGLDAGTLVTVGSARARVAYR